MMHVFFSTDEFRIPPENRIQDGNYKWQELPVQREADSVLSPLNSRGQPALQLWEAKSDPWPEIGKMLQMNPYINTPL